MSLLDLDWYQYENTHQRDRELNLTNPPRRENTSWFGNKEEGAVKTS